MIRPVTLDASDFLVGRLEHGRALAARLLTRPCRIARTILGLAALIALPVAGVLSLPFACMSVVYLVEGKAAEAAEGLSGLALMIGLMTLSLWVSFIATPEAETSKVKRAARSIRSSRDAMWDDELDWAIGPREAGRDA